MIRDIGPNACSEFGEPAARTTSFPTPGLTPTPEGPGAPPADADVQTSKGADASAGFSLFHSQRHR